MYSMIMCDKYIVIISKKTQTVYHHVRIYIYLNFFMKVLLWDLLFLFIDLNNTIQYNTDTHTDTFKMWKQVNHQY